VTGYFIRRFLLIIPTFIGITAVVFVIMHFVPGGPIERQIMRYRMAAVSEGGAVGGGSGMGTEIPPEALEEMRLSVRGLTGKPVPLVNALGDWRAEFVLRLSQAGVDGSWHAPADDDVPQLLSARAFVQTTRVLREAVDGLPPGQRDAIRMTKLEGLSLKEAAVASGMSVAALKVATHRGLKNLRKLIGDPKGKT